MFCDIILPNINIKRCIFGMKKVIFILEIIVISLIMCISVSAETLYGGNCNSHISWAVNSDNSLKIIGQDEMVDYSKSDNPPWSEYRKNIDSIVIQDTITHIGAYSFASTNISSIILPNSIISIGRNTFWECGNLREIVIPDCVQTIDIAVLGFCSSLEYVNLGRGLSVIPNGAFIQDVLLKSVGIHSGIASIGQDAFGSCTSLKTVYFYGTPEEWNAIDINPEGNEALLNANIVYISEVLPTSISISTKSTYIIGEDTDLNIAVTLNHNDGTTTTLSPDEYTLETDFDPNTEGEYNVKVTYGDFSNEVMVKVEPLKITSIAITTPPQKTKFVEGTELDLSGMVVTGTYNNGKTEEITNYTVSGYDSAKTGNQTLTISYNGLTVSLPVTVAKKSISGINITSLPDKLYYCNDETELDLTGLAVEMLYNNGTASECTSYTISGFDGTRTGTQTITISYRGFTDTFEIEVKRYDFKTDSNISKQYDFDAKALTVGAHITSRTDAKAVKVIAAVYNENNALMGVKMANTFFDTNEAKDLSIDVENVAYPFDKVKVFVWDFDLGKMLPLAVGV